MRLIDVDALIEAVENLYEYAELGEVIDVIKKAPTVEPENTRPHGKWIYKCRYGDEYPQCSNCGEINDVKTYFCPDCGADMRQEESDK